VEEARRDFTDALHVDPAFERARENLEPCAPASTLMDPRNGP